MTELLNKAFEEVSKLPPAQQDAIATLLLEQLTTDRLWSQALSSSGDHLRILADQAIREHQLGQTEELDPSAL